MNIAIVTGASSGMGREFVRQLGGYVSVDEIWAVARRASALETLKAETSVPVRPIVLDLLEESSFTDLEALLESEKPNVRLLVNAAGFGKFGAYQKVPVEDDCRMIDLNCKALLLMTRLSPTCSPAATFWSWTACLPSSQCRTSPPTPPPRPSSSATAAP